MKENGGRYKKYIELIINQNQVYINNIATAVGVSREIATKDLQKMIETGYFAGARIDVDQGIIILPQRTAMYVSQSPDIQPQEKVVQCQSCGANNKITVGQVSECEYCGTYLQ